MSYVSCHLRVFLGYFSTIFIHVGLRYPGTTDIFVLSVGSITDTLRQCVKTVEFHELPKQTVLACDSKRTTETLLSILPGRLEQKNWATRGMTRPSTRMYVHDFIPIVEMLSRQKR
jgi:hypothetical protein